MKKIEEIALFATLIFLILIKFFSFIMFIFARELHRIFARFIIYIVNSIYKKDYNYILLKKILKINSQISKKNSFIS
jgi:hypothetical protein